jgi:hypothetical protein
MKKRPQHKPDPPSATEVPALWAQHELGQTVLPDRRLVQRLTLLATQWADHPGASLAAACGSRKATDGAYDLLEEPDVQPQAIWGAHSQATLERIPAHPLVLAVQDTTALNYSHLSHTTGLGPIGNTAQGPQGLWLHHVQAFTPEGEPLGLLAARIGARDPKALGKSQQRYDWPLEDKESFKWMGGWLASEAAARQWPHTQVLSICDAEVDIYWLLLLAQQSDCANASLLVRVAQNRKVQTAPPRLWAHLHAQPIAAGQTVQVPRRQQQPERVATLEIRFCALTLAPPKRQATLPSIPLYGVEAYEPHPPPGIERICWRLLSLWPVTTAQEALICVQRYSKRWNIETYHKILKSGCKVEARQLETADNLQRLVAVAMVVAWRIFALTMAGRTHPEAPVSQWLEETEWQTLACWARQQARPPKEPPPVGEAVRWCAQLGGFLNRKSDGPPGPTCLWRGLSRLHDMALGFMLAAQEKTNER